MDCIPREKCKEGWVYRIRSRNLTVGVFHKKSFGDRFENGFVGIREKFGQLYLFTEFHRDDGAPYGTVSPESEIEKCPIECVDEDLGTVCETCRSPLEFVDGEKKYTGKWVHVVGSCGNPRAISVPNQALFDYLQALEKRVLGPKLCWRCRDGDHVHHVKDAWVICECAQCSREETHGP